MLADLKITRVHSSRLPQTDFSALGFGNVYSDHMFSMIYTDGRWQDPEILPFGPIELHPANSALQYGQAVFEGLKAFKQVDGNIVIFRPDKHIERINNSSRRICIPELDVDFVLEALKELVYIERDWIPTTKGESLYIRPFIFGADSFLGVRPSNNYKLIILLSPVGAYYPEGFSPVKILVQDDYVRAVRKGLGECKTPANYAASLLAGEEAIKKGFTQVLWLDGVEQKYIEEVGTMNMFVQFKDEVATPRLSGTILPGITRMSALEILKDWGYNVTERDISIQEIIDSYNKGNVVELFGTGTAAVISSISKLKYNDTILNFNSEHAGDLGTKLYKELTDIQYGRKEDKFNWMTIIK